MQMADYLIYSATEEMLAKQLTQAEGLDPEQTTVGLGNILPVGLECQLWQINLPQIRARLAAPQFKVAS